MSSQTNHNEDWGVNVLLLFTRRLEEEEQSRQKLQLEKVSIDAKLKQFEEKAVALQDSNAKVRKDRKGTNNQKQDRI